MAVSIVDGTLESFELKRKAPAVSIYRDLVIRHGDGGETRLRKSVSAAKVAEQLELGAKGRFYLYESIDNKGIHGVRLENGATVHAFPVMNERVMLLVLVINCVLLIGRILIESVLWYLPLALIVLAAIVYPLYRKTHLEAREQFQRDQQSANGR